MTRIRCDAADHPLAFEEVVLPLGRFFGLAQNGDVPDISELAHRHGLLLGRASERVSIVPATKDVAMHLGIPVAGNVLKVDRVVETADGEPVEWRVTFRKYDPLTTADWARDARQARPAKRYPPSSATLAQTIAKARAAKANAPSQTRSSRSRGGVFQEWAILHLAMCSRTRTNHKICVGGCPIIGEL